MSAAATDPQAARRRISIAALLAFVAGFVDTVGFIALFGLFTAHVTGNFVLIGAAIAGHHDGIVAKLLAFPVFVLAVAATRLAILACEKRRRDAVPVLLLAQAAFLLLFLAAAIAKAEDMRPDSAPVIAIGMLAVIAMAIQNAGARTLFAALAPTTVMTGNVTQVVIDLVDLAAGRPDQAETRTRLARMWPPVATFTLGALAGALSYAFIGFWGLVAPILGVLAILTLYCRTARNSIVP